MNISNLFDEYATLDLIIIFLVFLIFIFLLILIIKLTKKNKELKKQLSQINREINNIEILEDPTLEIPKDSILKEEAEILEDEILENTYEEEEIEQILEDLPEIEIQESGPYKKNVLRELSARSQTSPVNIGNSMVDVPKVKVTSYVKKEEVKKQEVKKEKKKINELDNKSFIEAIAKRMEDELKPETIELTDYEKKQEEEAIISYKELIEVKDKLYQQTDDEYFD